MNAAPKTAPRDSGPELLRIIAMLMIVALHYLNPNMGGALANTAPGTPNYYLVHALESLCIAGPNCFVLITGYFSVTKASVNVRKIIDLYVLMVFYALAFYFLVSRLAPSLIASGVTWRRLLAPFLTGDRWFVKAYMILLVLSPFLNKGLLELSRNGYRRLLIILLCLFSLWYSFLPGAPVADSGYGFINFVLLYCIAGYTRLHGPIKLPPAACAALFLLCAAATLAGKLTVFGNAWGYSFVTNIAGSVFLFLAFRQISPGPPRLISGLSARAFGMFLIHADISLVYILYRIFLRTQLFWNSPLLIPCALLSCVAVYAVASGIDKARALLFSVTIDRLLDRIPAANLQ